MKRPSKNILIVDNDLGFMFWLGAVLATANYQAWPAFTPSEAIAALAKKPELRLDLIIVNSTLPGVPELIAHFRRTQASLKVMAVGPQQQTIGGVDAWHLKPSSSDDAAKKEWIRAVRHIAGRQTRAA